MKTNNSNYINAKCKYYPCHNLSSDKFDCTFCYCPLYDICSKETKLANTTNVLGGYMLSNNLLACENCTSIHEHDTVQYIQEQLNSKVEISDIYINVIKKFKEAQNGKS